MVHKSNFWSNHASLFGGAIMIVYGGDFSHVPVAVLSDTEFSRNSAFGGIWYYLLGFHLTLETGGAIMTSLIGASVYAYNCSMLVNKASFGAGMMVYTTSFDNSLQRVVIWDSTIIGNLGRNTGSMMLN